MENWEPCLICSTLLPSSSTPSVLPTVPRGLNGDTVINDNLWPIFLLRNVLKVPPNECEKLLRQTYGLNPSSWFKVCDPCCETVNDAFLIHSHILKFEKNLEELREEVNNNINASLEFDFAQDAETEMVFSARKCIRNYFASNRHRASDSPTPIEFKESNSHKRNASDNENLPTGSKRLKRRKASKAQPVPAMITEIIESNLSHECRICGKMYSTERRLKFHTEAEHLSSSNTVEITTTIKKPRKKLNLKKVGTSTVSGGRFRTKTGVQPSSKSVQNQRLSCNECDYNCQKLKNLHIHVRIKHGTRPSQMKRFACSYCSESARSCIALNDHMKEVHPERFIYECNICEMKFRVVKLLRRHIQKTHSNSKFPCKKCGKEFDCGDYLQKHASKCTPSTKTQLVGHSY